MSVGASGFYTHTGHEEACPDLGLACINGPPPAPEWHDLKLTFLIFRVEGQYGITDWLSVDALALLRVTDIGFQLQDFATRQPIAGTDIHHRSETITGFADPWLSAHAARHLGHWRIGGRLGLTMPLGSTVDDPFLLGREGRPHEHIQYGTGTVDPIVGADASYPLGPLTMDVFSLARITLYENSHGYKAGNHLRGGLTATYPFKALGLTFGLDVADERAEGWHGTVYSEGNIGRTDLLADVRIAWALSPRWMTRLSALVPVYTHAEGAQLSVPATVELSIERSLRF